MSGKTWLVGIDGSDVAYKALRLATMLMDPYERLHWCQDGKRFATELFKKVWPLAPTEATWRCNPLST